jgi:hypothetical protein
MKLVKVLLFAPLLKLTWEESLKLYKENTQGNDMHIHAQNDLLVLCCLW